MNERSRSSAEKLVDNKDIERAAGERREVIREQLEGRAERRGEQSHERAETSRERAHELARETKELQNDAPERAEETQPEQAPVINSRVKRKQAFTETMDTARNHMSPGARNFSKVIHQPAVERVSEAAGKTIARPNAILGGSMTAFFVVLIVFLVARYYGYPLSGAESILAFAAGWVLGIVFDYLRVMITGRHT